MGFYPIGDGLMANTQRPSNPALIHAVHVQAQGLMANFLGVACFACHWRVFSSAYFAHVALATRCIMTDFDLLFASFTVRTFYHPGILPYPHTLPLPTNPEACDQVNELHDQPIAHVATHKSPKRASID